MSRTSRKLDHIKHALELGQSGDHGFSDIQFVPNCLPEMNIEDVQLATNIGELHLSSPILINAMTGGGSDGTFQINQQLALIAKEKGLAMAVGSQMAALKDPEQVYTYRVVREQNPKGIIFANLGAEATVEQAQRAVNMLEANALQIHLNVVQELVMPEGDRRFKGILKRIENIVRELPCPVLIKEVGFGMNFESVKRLQSIGVKAVDIGGFGGTNFASIENKRRDQPYEFFNQWGLKTVPSLIEVTAQGNIDAIASGGIQSPFEIMKSLVLGARAVGMAGFFLRLVKEKSLTEIFHIVDSYHEQLKVMMCALGISTLKDVDQVPLVISGESQHWLKQRGIDVTHYARRGK